jgi:hypothetical protein
MNQNKKPSSAGAIKVIAAAGAVAGSIGLWGMFSNKSIEIANQKLVEGKSSGGVTSASQPLVVNTPFQPDPTATATAEPIFREVNINFDGAPTPAQPVIQRIVVDTGGSGTTSGSGGGSASSASAPAPVTNTKTS